MRLRKGMTVAITDDAGRVITGRLAFASLCRSGNEYFMALESDGERGGRYVAVDRVRVVSTATGARRSTNERFNRYVRRTRGCWLWTGCRGSRGYGVFRLGGKSVNASRASYILAHGPVADDMQVCHRCDNPQCVRPDHLFGTGRENMHDAVKKGRLATAYASRRKFTREQLEEQFAARRGVTEIARTFGVTRAAIYKAKRSLATAAQR